MGHHNDEAMNKIPLKASTIPDDEEKHEYPQFTETAEDARREQMRVNILHWMKKLTIVLICFIGIALISFVVISLCLSDWSKPSTKAITAPIAQTTILPTPVSNSTFERALLTILNSTNSSSSPSSKANISSGTTITSSETADAQHLDFDYLLVSPPSEEIPFNSLLGVYRKAAVTSDSDVCSRVGSYILEQNGSAVDAAISVSLCNGLVVPQSTGIGGGMFMNVFIKEDNQAYTVDAREVAPYAATPNMFNNKKRGSLAGGLAIAVPGEVMGYFRAHARFGNLPWKLLFNPSLKICQDGIYVTHHTRLSLEEKLQDLRPTDSIFRMYFNSTTGKMYPVGQKIKIQKELCETYRMLAENGPLDFYNGTLAQLIAADLKDLGSVVTLYDLGSYIADVVNSISMQLGDDVLYATPPVTSATVVANVLSILEGYNFTHSDLENPKRLALTIHRITEAIKFGYAKRFELGDMRFNDVRELISKLTNPEYAASLRARINDSYTLRTPNDYDARYIGKQDSGTSHISILAPNGDAVALTSTINHYFGCGRMGKRTGIIFNSGMDDFAIEGQDNMFNIPFSQSNGIQGLKRAMSSMSPIIIATFDGDVRIVIGSAGGSKIIAGVVEVIVRLLWLDQDIKEAIDAPRFYNQLHPNILEIEGGLFNDEVLEILRTKGHQVTSMIGSSSVVNGIVRNSTAIYANADYRKRGGVAGF